LLKKGNTLIIGTLFRVLVSVTNAVKHLVTGSLVL